ncbi:class IV adenylate cyclase [Patescibacteria group bacterium]
MAKDNIEIEIKIPVSKKVFADVKRVLDKEAKFISATKEIDKYFNPPHRSFLETKHPYEYLRLRLKKNQGVLTYKYIHFNQKGQKTHANEYESTLGKPIQLEKILTVLDFKNFLTIEKLREKYVYQHQFEIVLDKVKNLGYFIEIEALKNLGGVKLAQKKLKVFAQKIGLDPTKKDNLGYILLMMKKKGLWTPD